MDDLQAELEEIMKKKQEEEPFQVRIETPKEEDISDDSDGNKVARYKRILKGLV